MSRFIIILSVFIFSARVQARLLVDVNMVYKNGIDKNLVLVSELHSVEEVWGERLINLTMKNGTSLLIKAGFWERPMAKLDDLGPSSKIFFEGKLFHPNGQLAKEVVKQTSQVELGDSLVVAYKDKTHIIEVTIRPYLK